VIGCVVEVLGRQSNQNGKQLLRPFRAINFLLLFLGLKPQAARRNPSGVLGQERVPIISAASCVVVPFISAASDVAETITSVTIGVVATNPEINEAV
jgi:hypothetical protein